MSNDSSTGGVLAPAPPPPLDDQAFDRLLQQLLVALTGLDGTLVRPRWQPEPPDMPGNGTAWLAFGVVDVDGDTFPVVAHSPTGDGSDTIYRTERVPVLISCYGPNARSLASVIRDGLAVPQNRDPLVAQGVQLLAVGTLTVLPALVNERFQYRVDVPVLLTRGVTRTYPVLNLVSAEGEVVTDTEPPLTAPVTVSP